MRILLVEDDPATAAGLAEELTAAGHGVDRAATGERARAMLAGGRYDAAAIDLVLPACTGDRVALEASRRGVGVVLMSAATPALLATVDDLRGTLELAGCPVDSVMRKPVTADALLAALEKAARDADPMRKSVSVEDVIGGEGAS